MLFYFRNLNYVYILNFASILTVIIEIMEVVLIIGAILEIVILVYFFILCSNVSKIKKQLVQNYDFEAKFNFLMKIGEKEKAREILINCILANTNIFTTEVSWNADKKAKMCFDIYEEELAALGIENPFPKDEKKE